MPFVSHNETKSGRGAARMIDTVKLYTTDFAVRPENRLTWRTDTNALGEVVSEKAFVNLEHLTAEVEGSELWLQFSAPKVAFGTSLLEVGEGDFGAVCGEVARRLDKAGVEVGDLGEALVSRVDFCRNMRMSRHAAEYVALLGSMSMARREKRAVALETVSFRNQNRELTFYDKVAELVARGELAGGRKRDVLRGEVRLRRRRAVVAVCGREHLRELWDGELARKVLVREYDSLVFRTGEQMRLLFDETADRLRELRKLYKRGAFHKFLVERGARGFLADMLFDWALVRDLLFEVCPRATAYRYLGELRRLHQGAVGPSERELLEEIRVKLAA